jgi:hypothetical protein
MSFGGSRNFVLAAAAILIIFVLNQNCSGIDLDTKTSKKNLSSLTGDSTGGTVGGTSGGSSGFTSGGTSSGGGTTGSSGTTGQFTTPTTDAEEDAVDCGPWICGGMGDYSCDIGFNDQQWQEAFMALLDQYEAGPVATMEALELIEAELFARGVLLQRNSAGILRGRLYLPTNNYCARWERAIDVITGWDGQWAWVPRGDYHF